MILGHVGLHADVGGVQEDHHGDEEDEEPSHEDYYVLSINMISITITTIIEYGHHYYY